MYRLMVESLPGLNLRGDKFFFVPCWPSHWSIFKLHYRFQQTMFHITVEQIEVAGATSEVRLDGLALSDAWVSLCNDLVDHHVRVRAGRSVNAFN